jgi:hypothetical protein
MDLISFTTFCEKIMWHEKNNYLNKFFNNFFFDAIHHYTQVHILHLYMIHWCTHSSRFEFKTSWNHAKVLITKPLQNLINKEDFYYYYVWHGIVWEIQILTYFFFQNLFKYYKWKHNLEAYSKCVYIKY